MYDAIARHEAIERIVCRYIDGVQERKYYRFRGDRFYGGIATGDCSGCGLFCHFCWVSNWRLAGTDPRSTYYAPDQVAKRLLEICKARGFSKARLSGGEPTIGKAHLLAVLEELSKFGNVTFILESNGILLGHDSSYSKSLADYPFVHVCISIKTCTPQNFSKFTGAKPEGFELQLRALRHLSDAGVSCHPAVFAAFDAEEDLQSLTRRVAEIDSRLAGAIEVEDYMPYREAVARMTRLGYPAEIATRPRSLGQVTIVG